MMLSRPDAIEPPAMTAGEERTSPAETPRFRMPSFWGLAGFLLALAGWQALVSFGGYPEILLPSPLAVARDMINQYALVLQHSAVTLRQIVYGFLLSVGIGVPIAFAIAFSRPLSKLLMPLLVVSNSIPKVAIAPLFLIWFGFGQMTNVILAILVAIFPIVINTTLGLTHLDPDLVRLGRIMGGNRFRIFWHIRLPAALPSIFAGLKVGITLATIGVVVGEMIAGQEGIGYLSQYAASQLLTVMTFSCIVAMSMLGVALFYAVVLAEYLIVGSTRTRAG
jgi:NitT/TauT family transport system permease protein